MIRSQKEEERYWAKEIDERGERERESRRTMAANSKSKRELIRLGINLSLYVVFDALRLLRLFPVDDLDLEDPPDVGVVHVALRLLDVGVRNILLSYA